MTADASRPSTCSSWRCGTRRSRARSSARSTPADIPKLLGLYRDGQLKLDELITNRYPLDEINEGYQAMRDGKNIRGVIVYDAIDGRCGTARRAGPPQGRRAAARDRARRRRARRRPPRAARGPAGHRGSRRCCGPVADELGIGFEFVEGNAELTPGPPGRPLRPGPRAEDGYDPDVFVDGPLVSALREGSLLYVEEINRVPEETLNVLITVMSEGELHVPRLGRIAAARASGWSRR